MLFGLYLMFELFLLIGYFAYSYDHITGYTRVRKHPREMHPAEYLIGITIFTFLSIDLNGQIMLSDTLIYPANASSCFLLVLKQHKRKKIRSAHRSSDFLLQLSHLQIFFQLLSVLRDILIGHIIRIDPFHQPSDPRIGERLMFINRENMGKHFTHLRTGIIRQRVWL